jgi:hypothetical protein
VKNSRDIKIPEFVNLDKLGPELKVKVRTSTRAKRYLIRIKHHKTAELILPSNNFEVGYRFLLQKEAWVRKKLLNYSDKLAFADYNQLPIWGKARALQYIEAPHSGIKIHEDRLQVYSPFLKRRDTLMRHLSEALFEKIQNFAKLIGGKYNLSFTKIRITNNKSNWGSCSSKGILSFNWRLIFTPVEVIHYVVIHEMCHLLEMNHSPRFWLLVKQIYPDYKFYKAWLKENGSLLHLYLLKEKRD